MTEQSFKEKVAITATQAVNLMAQSAIYKEGCWSSEFSVKELEENLKKYQNYIKDNYDLLSLSVEELKILGFKYWDEENKFILIPLYIFDCIPDGTDLYCISGEVIKKNGRKGIDLDTRFGCIPYGIMPCGGAEYDRQ